MTKQHLCQLCDKTFTRAYDLKRHTKDKHSGQSLNTHMDSYHQTPSTISNPKALQHPFTCMVSGPTGSGKTKWVENLILNVQQTIVPPPDRIVWCYGQWQPIYDKLLASVPGIEFYHGIPVQIDTPSFFNRNVTNLIVLDDLMTEARDDRRVSNLFSKGSHHMNLSVIYIVQNIFNQGKMARNISLNTQYLVLFKSPRDKQQIMVLARQLYPRQTERFLNMYEEATKRPYGYLFIDLKPNTPDNQRLKTNVLPQESTLPNPLQDDNHTIAGPIQNLASSVQNFVKGQTFVQSPQVAQAVRLDQQINELLNTHDIPPDQKASLYSQLFLRQQKYLDKIHNNTTPIQNNNTPTVPNLQTATPPGIPEQLGVEKTPHQQTPAEFSGLSTKSDSGIGTGKVSINPKDVFQSVRDKIQERRKQLREKESTPMRLRDSPLISFEDDDETKRRKIQQARQTEPSEIRKRILENPSSLSKTWITTADDKETRLKKQRLAEKRERKARQPFTPSDY